MRSSIHSRQQLSAFSARRFSRARVWVPLAVLALGAVFWPERELSSSNFIFYFPSAIHTVPMETVGTARYLPLLQILNLVGKVGGIQENQNSVTVWFGSTPIELRANETRVQLSKENYELPQPVHVTDGQWMVPVSFLTTVLPRLTHQGVEYQEGSDRIFVGDVKPASFSIRLDPLPNGARLSIQFTDKVVVHTASSNGKWILFLGDHAIEPMEPSYHFQNSYISDLRFDDQDGQPKLVLSPGSTGLNFYPMQAENGKMLLADVVKPSAAAAQATPAPTAPPSAPVPGQPAQGGPQPGAQSPAAPPAPLPVIALDAGHGGQDLGARSSNGVAEKDLVADYVAKARAALLATNKYRVILTRPGDASVGYEQRALASNLANAECFLSFHAADLGSGSPRIAVFTFGPPTAAPVSASEAPVHAFIPWDHVQEARLDHSVQLAAALQQQFATMDGVGVNPPAMAPVRTLRSVNAPAVAIELGSLDPDSDAAALTNPAFQQQVADAIVQAMAVFEKGAAQP